MLSFLIIDAGSYSDKIIKTEGFLPTLEFGLQMLLIGMGTVFASLALLWGCLSIFKIVFYDMKNKKAKPDAIPAPIAETIQSDSSDDEEIVAVIAAAIAAAQSENPTLKFRVVAFNRK